MSRRSTTVLIVCVLGLLTCSGLLVYDWSQTTRLVEIPYEKHPTLELIWGEDCFLYKAITFQVENQTIMNSSTFLRVEVLDKNSTYEFADAYFQFPNRTGWKFIEMEWKDGIWTANFVPDLVGDLWVLVRVYFDNYYVQSLVRWIEWN